MYIKSEDTCIGESSGTLFLSLPPPLHLLHVALSLKIQLLLLSKRAAKNMSAFGWLVTALVVSCLAGAGVAGYVFYKYRLRV